jgi:hypothetical protein
MPDKLKIRIYLFYAAGVVNLLFCAYVMFFGRGFLPDDKITMLILSFLGFAAVNFWMPVLLKKKWIKDQAAYDAQQRAQGSQGSKGSQGSQPPPQA